MKAGLPGESARVARHLEAWVCDLLAFEGRHYVLLSVARLNAYVCFRAGHLLVVSPALICEADDRLPPSGNRQVLRQQHPGASRGAKGFFSKPVQRHEDKPSSADKSFGGLSETNEKGMTRVHHFNCHSVV